MLPYCIDRKGAPEKVRTDILKAGGKKEAQSKEKEIYTI